MTKVTFNSPGTTPRDAGADGPIVRQEPPRVPAPDPVELAEKAVQNASRLDAFLSAKPRLEPRTDTYAIESLNTDIVFRELNEAELEDFFNMQMERANPQRRNRKPNKGLIDQAYRMAAQAVVDPNFHDSNVMERIRAKFGEHLISVEDVLRLFIPPLDVLDLQDRILTLSSHGQDEVEEAKN